ncbi:MAG: helix-turn-helix domain-containing protein [Comamonas sp.]|uniref:helix-turn-helix domain-containing protein n=1 Tax=Comamonas sp. TaxID=34028 RepID=UPI002838865E|nr:helix-turn-helix domain-containing protein [Comamonas sp.]MDR0213205.1 helix-turn-helix domain-containing protein [Comamonas sp.]
MTVTVDVVLTFPEQLGLYLKSLRKAAGLSQAKLAQLLGVSQSRVAAIEKDPASVSVGQFLTILKMLNADLVVRQTDTAKAKSSQYPKQGSALSLAPVSIAQEVARQGLPSQNMSAQTIAEAITQGLHPELGKALGMAPERARETQRNNVTEKSDAKFRPQDLPADWQSKKPKGSW